jgi:hypothetical protein
MEVNWCGMRYIVAKFLCQVFVLCDGAGVILVIFIVPTDLKAVCVVT